MSGLGTTLGEILLEVDVRPGELAKACGISASHVSAVAGGTKPTRPTTVRVLVDGLVELVDVDPDATLDRLLAAAEPEDWADPVDVERYPHATTPEQRRTRWAARARPAEARLQREIRQARANLADALATGDVERTVRTIDDLRRGGR